MESSIFLCACFLGLYLWIYDKNRRFYIWIYYKNQHFYVWICDKNLGFYVWICAKFCTFAENKTLCLNEMH